MARISQNIGTNTIISTEGPCTINIHRHVIGPVLYAGCMPQFLANSSLGLIYVFSVQTVFICLNLIDLSKKNTFFYLKLNFRPKNGLLEIAACNLEGPFI